MLGETALVRHQVCTTDEKEAVETAGNEPVSGIGVGGSHVNNVAVPSNDPRSSLFTSSMVKGDGDEEASIGDDALDESARGRRNIEGPGGAMFSFTSHGGALNAA